MCQHIINKVDSRLSANPPLRVSKRWRMTKFADDRNGRKMHFKRQKWKVLQRIPTVVDKGRIGADNRELIVLSYVSIRFPWNLSFHAHDVSSRFPTAHQGTHRFTLMSSLFRAEILV